VISRFVSNYELQLDEAIFNERIAVVLLSTASGQAFSVGSYYELAGIVMRLAQINDNVEGLDLDKAEDPVAQAKRSVEVSKKVDAYLKQEALKGASRNLVHYIEKNVDGFSEEFIELINEVKYCLDNYE